MSIIINCVAKKALDLLNASGYQAYIVGGAVRDYLLGITPEDFDLTTNATPTEIIEVFKDYTHVDCGTKHGTVKVIIDEYVIDITTYRTESLYFDNRHPSAVEFTSSLKEDLKRRDFTINAVCLDANGEIIDIMNGVEDLKKGVIKAIGNPYERLSEDSLRILRALRMSSIFGFSIDDNLCKAIIELKDGLKMISGERIRDELKKILLGKNVKSIVLTYIEVFAVIIPELLDSYKFDQHSKYHIYDVLEHSLVAIENVKSDWQLKMALLLHDLGKPFCFTIGDNGQGHAYNHNENSYTISKKVLDRLKVTNIEKNKILNLVRFHNYRTHSDNISVKKSLNKFGLEFLNDLLCVQQADTLAKNPKMLDSCYNSLDTINRTRQEIKKIIENKECYSLSSLAINGNDLIQNGFSQGEIIKNTLNKLLELVIENKCKNNKNELLEVALKYKK